MGSFRLGAEAVSVAPRAACSSSAPFTALKRQRVAATRQPSTRRPGKNDSIASSAKRTSTGRPEHAAVARGHVGGGVGAAVVIGGNLLWIAASVALMAFDWIAPNGFGYAFIGAQAAAVAVLAMLELRALRRGSAPALA